MTRTGECLRFSDYSEKRSEFYQASVLSGLSISDNLATQSIQ